MRMIGSSLIVLGAVGLLTGQLGQALLTRGPVLVPLHRRFNRYGTHDLGIKSPSSELWTHTSHAPTDATIAQHHDSLLSIEREYLIEAYQKNTVKTLKEWLKERSLPRTGRKMELILRLVEHELTHTAALTTPSTEPSPSPQSTPLSHSDWYSLVRETLYTRYRKEDLATLQDMAQDRGLPVLDLHDDLAERLAVHDLLESPQVARYLCHPEGHDASEWSDALAGVTATGSIFEPGKLPYDFVIDAVEHLRDQRMIHKIYVQALLEASLEYFCQLPSVLRIPIPTISPSESPAGVEPRITVCGDTHGQFYDLLHIFQLNGLPHSNNPYVFNGDFVDRGAFGLEIVLTLLLFKLYDPECIHLLRGNHETLDINSYYGFKGEVYNKLDSSSYELCSRVFQWLPLAAVIDDRVFVTHGGIPTGDSVTLTDIERTPRGTEPMDTSLMFELLWNDPQESMGVRPSGRGGSARRFGPDVTTAFLERNQLELLVRSHEVRYKGYSVEQEGRTITVFSAPNYCDRVGNQGAMLHLDRSQGLSVTLFDCVPHP